MTLAPALALAALIASAPAPTVTVSVDTTATTVGGRVVLEARVAASPGWRVEPPARQPFLGAFAVRSIEALPAEAGDLGFRWSLVPLEPGEHEVGPGELAAVDDDGERVALTAEPVTIRVASSLPPPEPAAGDGEGEVAGDVAPADYKPPLDAPRDWRPVWIALAAAAVAAAAGAWALRRWRERRRRPGAPAPPVRVRIPARPAWEIALESLDRIAAEGWPERGEIRRQYEEVTAVVRRYLEDRWGVPALESTTDELRARLARTPVPEPVAPRVLELLGEADLVKFAKARPPAEAAAATERRARDIVRETTPVAPPREEAA